MESATLYGIPCDIVGLESARKHFFSLTALSFLYLLERIKLLVTTSRSCSRKQSVYCVLNCADSG